MVSYQKYTLKSGKTRWRVCYRDPDNRNREKASFERKIDAERWAAENVTMAKATGTFVDPSAGRVTVGKLGDEWIAAREHVVKPNTYRPEKSDWTNHVKPRWGNIPVAGLTSSAVQSWISELSGEYSPSLVLRCRGILKGIVETAIADRIIGTDPMRGIKLPKKVKKPNVYLTLEQLKQLAAASGSHSALILTLGMCGLRWGEAAALKVNRIDFKANRLHIVENFSKDETGLRKNMVIVTPKSYRYRDVPMPKIVRDALEVQMRGKQPDDLVFTDDDGTPIRYQGPHVRGWYRNALKACAGTVPEDLRCHDLRHTTASLAVRAGVNIKALQRMLGHASAKETLDVYADLFDDDLDVAAERIDALSRPVPKPRFRQKRRVSVGFSDRHRGHMRS